MAIGVRELLRNVTTGVLRAASVSGDLFLLFGMLNKYAPKEDATQMRLLRSLQRIQARVIYALFRRFSPPRFLP